MPNGTRTTTRGGVCTTKVFLGARQLFSILLAWLQLQAYWCTCPCRSGQFRGGRERPPCFRPWFGREEKAVKIRRSRWVTIVAGLARRTKANHQHRVPLWWTHPGDSRCGTDTREGAGLLVFTRRGGHSLRGTKPRHYKSFLSVGHLDTQNM